MEVVARVVVDWTGSGSRVGNGDESDGFVAFWYSLRVLDSRCFWSLSSPYERRHGRNQRGNISSTEA